MSDELNKDLCKALVEADEVDLIALRHCLRFADNLAFLKKLYKEVHGKEISHSALCERFKIKKKDIPYFLVGAFNYDMRHLAIIDTVISDLKEKVREMEVEGAP